VLIRLLLPIIISLHVTQLLSAAKLKVRGSFPIAHNFLTIWPRSWLL